MWRVLPWLLILVVAAAEVSAQKPPQPTGSVTAGPWQITWSPTGASARNRVSGLTLKLYDNEGDDTDYRRSYLVSVVGPVVSVQTDYNSESGPMHSSSGTWLEASRLEERVSFAQITDLFDSHDVLRALLRVKRIRCALEGQAPTSLDELVQQLPVECWTNWSSLLGSYAIMSARRDIAVVRFSVVHGCELAAGTVTAFDVRLRIPRSKRRWFAEARAAGTLGMAPTAEDSWGGKCPPAVEQGDEADER
jgi:hypothetical protein